MSWQRAIRWKLLVVFGPIFFASLAIGFASHDPFVFVAGFFGGASAGAAIAVREQPPAHLQTWGDGYAGERATHHELNKLGWNLIDDVDAGRGNYDHLLVGPRGVFMLESKNFTGITSVKDDVPWLHRRHDPEADRPLVDSGRACRACAGGAHPDLARPWLRGGRFVDVGARGCRRRGDARPGPRPLTLLVDTTCFSRRPTAAALIMTVAASC